MEFTVLGADDELELLDALELYLVKENIRLLKAGDGRQALSILQANDVHLLLLDIMMPELDGYTVLREVRKNIRIPVILISARGADHEKILGLDLGADDYIAKPFNPLEVTARVKAQLLRNYYFNEPKDAQASISLHGLKLDNQAYTLTKNGVDIPLTSTEYKILSYLMDSPGRIFTKRQIYEYVWNDYYIENDGTLMMHLSNLRAKIEDNPKQPVIIKTVKGIGYKIEKEK